MASEHLLTKDVFGFLRPEQINKISEASVIAKFAAGETIYTKGAKASHLYVVIEGEVALRLPGKGPVSVLIDQLGPGAMFGSSVSFDSAAYMLMAQSLTDGKVLRIETAVLRRLMDEDTRMGYAMQSRISEIYFRRYVDTMQKLQAIVMNLPLEAR